MRYGVGIVQGGQGEGRGVVTSHVVQLVVLRGRVWLHVPYQVLGCACRAVPAAATWPAGSCSDGEMTTCLTCIESGGWLCVARSLGMCWHVQA